ncbi:MAG: ATP-dependent DNA helicase RecG [Chitinophagaceae bacterium]|jgi:ATP-dependent DNA helicase RecG|nr:ATP-dependent DNA helicase RecG [Chitinophagaceae bacterium]
MPVDSILLSPIEYLKGVGPQRGELLRKELNLNTFGDLLLHFPYRYIDRTRVYSISSITPGVEQAQVRGKLLCLDESGAARGRKLAGILEDPTGQLDLLWFQGIVWAKKGLQVGGEYLVFGKVSWFKGRPQITHPEIEPVDTENAAGKNFLEPIYPTTEKLKQRFITGRALGKMVAALLTQVTPADVPEFLPAAVLHRMGLLTRYDALRHIHFPPQQSFADAALQRLKFEELFLLQLKLNEVKIKRHRQSKGVVFASVGQLFNDFYKNHLPFELTNAQKRVIKEIRADTAHGRQMNRLLQGDVGSGKTIVALLCMLLAVDNGYQCCLMAPTEILARQHYEGIKDLLAPLGMQVGLLTGSVKAAARRQLLADSASGQLPILIGTHALIEDTVQFAKLGFVVIDEQHRFGVEQRAKLWQKAEIPPHVLVMTATPIPRTLSMSLFGDLDCSVMDELPPGRKPINTVHRYESSRHNVMEFARQQITQGRQVYIIFPLIEESEKMAYENLMRGYENVKAFFPEPKYWISMVHGRMDAAEKDTNMQRFKTGDTQIMVSTTVIEVGVNVPNASVMIIESAEKFGLSQLHQLRGRVGRGSDQSFCILLTGPNLTTDARQRLKIMCETNDGFKIAEKDMELRGPGDIEGTRQSGMLNFRLASLVNDKELMEKAQAMATALLEQDIELALPENQPLRNYLLNQQGKTEWSKIS